jgi:circadian clock protein KaiB
VLTLYIAGVGLRSMQALRSVKRFCAANPAERYTLEVVDVFQQPEKARAAGILAAPALVRHRPPSRRIIGGLSDMKRLERGIASRRGE